MAPYPGYGADYAQTLLDPETQAAIYLDAVGNVMEVPEHGTSTGTNPPTGTGNPSDEQGPGASDTGNDTDQCACTALLICVSSRDRVLRNTVSSTIRRSSVIQYVTRRLDTLQTRAQFTDPVA